MAKAKTTGSRTNVTGKGWFAFVKQSVAQARSQLEDNLMDYGDAVYNYAEPYTPVDTGKMIESYYATPTETSKTLGIRFGYDTDYYSMVYQGFPDDGRQIRTDRNPLARPFWLQYAIEENREALNNIVKKGIFE